MRWSTWPDRPSFLAAAGPYLRAAPLVNQIPLAIATQLEGAPARLHSVHDSDGTCLGAVVQTPPYKPALSQMTAAAATFAGAHFVAEHADVDGVLGPDEEAAAFAAAACEGRRVEIEQAMGLFSLRTVAEVRLPEGHRRPVDLDDTPLLHAWLRAFHEEAIPSDPPLPDDAGARTAARGRSHFWIDRGEPVAFACYGRELEGYVSVGPVYTPPACRGRGYATGLVTEMSAAALADGRVGCTLFTDLANPTSNRIYERIGYVRIGTMKRLVISPP